MAGPLEGVRVLDFSTMVSGPVAARMLADQGADVIKVERPGDGDQSRYSGPDKALNEIKMGTAYLNQGSNKRSITLDLKTGRIERDRTLYDFWIHSKTCAVPTASASGPDPNRTGSVDGSPVARPASSTSLRAWSAGRS